MNKKSLIIILILAWSISPILWQLYTSFSTPEALLNPFDFSQINRWTLENYKLLLYSKPGFWRYILNSTILGLISTLLTLIISIPAAYSISRVRNQATKIYKLFLISAALFPYVLLFLALLEVARNLNLGNNLLALSIPYTALSLPLAILLLSSAFDGVPIDLEDAAKIEGLNIYQRIKDILLPLMAPAIGSTSILVFLFSWNEYPISLTWISKTNLLTLPVAIARIAGSSVYSVPYGAFAAATVLGSIPLIMIVFVFQKQIVSGLTQGAIKG